MNMNEQSIKKLIKAGIAIFVGLFVILVLNPFVTIDTGERGIVFSKFGWVNQEEMGEWLHFRIPFIESVTIMNVQSEKLVFSNLKEYQNNRDIKVLSTRLASASSDLQDVFVDAIITYHVNPEEAAKVHQEVGKDYPLKKIVPAVIDVIKTETAKFKVYETLQNREKITQNVNEKLRTLLLKENIVLENVALSNFDFDPKFKSAIEDKQVAAVNKEKEQITLDTVAIKAQQKVKQAEADRDAAIEIAEGQKQAKIKEWEWIKSYNEAIKKELTPLLIEYKELENNGKAIDKWSGAYPETYMGSDGAIPLVNIGK